MGQIVSDVSSVLEYQDAKKEAKSKRQQVLQQIASDEAAKTNLVQKALATQRAKYGAGGMSGRGMTEGAVLKRLKSETEQPYNEKRRANMDKLKSIKAQKPNIVKSLLKHLDALVG